MKFNTLFSILLSEAKNPNIHPVRAFTRHIYFPKEDEFYSVNRAGNWELLAQGIELSDRKGNDISEDIKHFFPRGFQKVYVALGKDIKKDLPDAIVFSDEEYEYFIIGSSFSDNIKELAFIDPTDEFNLDQDVRDVWQSALNKL